MASPAENAATVREALLRHFDVRGSGTLHPNDLAILDALAALLAQAEAAEAGRRALDRWQTRHAEENKRRKEAEDDRDAAVRERDRLREAAAAVLDYDHHPSRASLSALRAALTGEGQS